MSADNGVYIAKFGTKDFRVIHAGAIENLDYYPRGSSDWKKTVKDYFGNAQSFETQTDAMLLAINIAEEIQKDEVCPVLEYGINYIGDYSDALI